MLFRSAMSQNILYYCYDKPKTVEELTKLCGIPAYYVEDCIQNLLQREAVFEAAKGKFRTDFMIYTDEVAKYTDKVSSIFEPIIDSFIKSLKMLTEGTRKLGIYTADKSDDELIYLYGVMALEHLSRKYNPVKFIEYPVKYDGCRWSYHAHLLSDNKYPVRGLGREVSMNCGSRGHYSHYSYHFGGF